MKTGILELTWTIFRSLFFNDCGVIISKEHLFDSNYDTIYMVRFIFCFAQTFIYIVRFNFYRITIDNVSKDQLVLITTTATNISIRSNLNPSMCIVLRVKTGKIVICRSINLFSVFIFSVEWLNKYYESHGSVLLKLEQGRF